MSRCVNVAALLTITYLAFIESIRNTVKLFLQITLGVFIGTLAAQFVIDRWHIQRESLAKAALEKLRMEQEKVRLKQNEQIRNLIMQGRQADHPRIKKYPDGFVPDDAQ